jgi:hypothetical protein
VPLAVADVLPNGADQTVLDDVEVQVGDPGVGVGLLETERVERHREAGRRVGLQVTEDGLRVLPLPREQVRGPDGITRMGAKTHEVHCPDVLRRPAVGVVVARLAQVVGVRAVDALLEFVRDRYETRRAPVEDPRQRHSESVVIEHPALLGQPGKPDPPPVVFGLPIDGLLHELAEPDEGVAGEDLGTQQAVSHDERVGGELVAGDEVMQRGPLAQVPVDLDPSPVTSGHHVGDVAEAPRAQVVHELPEYGAVAAVAAAELVDVGGGRHHVEEQLLALRVHDPDHLQLERVEGDRVVAAVGSGQRDGGGGARSDRADVRSEPDRLLHEVVEHPGLNRGLSTDLAPQLGKLLGSEQRASRGMPGSREGRLCYVCAYSECPAHRQFAT